MRGRVAVTWLLALGCATAEPPPTSPPPVAVTARPALAPAWQPPRLELGVYEGVPWPIELAPVDGPLPDPPARPAPPPPAATAAAARVLAVVETIHATATASSYQHQTRVREADGVYDWDCSGMTAWILRRAAPTAWRALARGRPVARDFAARIARSPTDRPRAGWQRIARIEDVRPGDVFAWRRPRGLPSKNTGHVGFVVDQPIAVPGLRGGWLVRIADSTSSRHQDDTRAGDADGGFGIGAITVLVDGDGRATHYGWAGTRSEVYVVTPVVFGRVSR